MLRCWTRNYAVILSAAFFLTAATANGVAQDNSHRSFWSTWKSARLIGYRGPYAGGCENPSNGPSNRWFDSTGRWTGNGTVDPMSTYQQPCPQTVNLQPIRSNER